MCGRQGPSAATPITKVASNSITTTLIFHQRLWALLKVLSGQPLLWEMCLVFGRDPSDY